MSVSDVVNRLITVRKGEKMWLSRKLTAKSTTELVELKQELRAVHNMFVKGYISIAQLRQLEHTIVNETPTPKPEVLPPSTRSVSRLARRFENRNPHGYLINKPTELLELEQELTAVHDMFMLDFIGSSQLRKLEQTIINETASVKPQIRTKSTRSVSQLAQRFENRTHLDSSTKINTAVIKLGGDVSERVQRYETRFR